MRLEGHAWHCECDRRTLGAHRSRHTLKILFVGLEPFPRIVYLESGFSCSTLPLLLAHCPLARFSHWMVVLWTYRFCRARTETCDTRVLNGKYATTHGSMAEYGASEWNSSSNNNICIWQSSYCRSAVSLAGRLSAVECVLNGHIFGTLPISAGMWKFF